MVTKRALARASCEPYIEYGIKYKSQIGGMDNMSVACCIFLGYLADMPKLVRCNIMYIRVNRDANFMQLTLPEWKYVRNQN